jgi:octaprenyl-diphosphate synthase
MHPPGNTAAVEEPLLTARRIFGLVARELALVEEEFERQARSNIQVIAYIGDYLRASGGKRVRPALTLLSANAVGGDASRPNVIRMATVMEFLHTATLVHDDIIDNAETRRNRPSINSRFGNQTAVLMGDWLYMSAFETSLQERSLPVLDILTAVTRKMTEGELLQLTLIGRADVTEEQYFDILRRKTAYLFSACCEIGAILGGADEASQAALRDYGMSLGVAFQLVDDLLDFTARESELGKPVLSDLKEGKLTLPLILLLPRVTPAERRLVEMVLEDRSFARVSPEEILDLVRTEGTLEEVSTMAEQLAAEAKRELEFFPPGDAREALEFAPDFVLHRRS